MDFNKKKIRSDHYIKRQETARKTLSWIFSKIKSHFIIFAIIISGLLVTYTVAAKVIDTVSTLSVKNILLSIVSSPLKEDEFGHTNFLMLGIGGGDHDGAELTDSIIVASLDEKNNLIPMLSIPRDFYVKDEEIGSDRINRYYELKKMIYEENGYQESEAQTLALEDTSIKIGEILGIEIQYYALINFDGFTEVVDAMDGIDIYLDESFYDNQYPIGETGFYETFSLPAGENHLDGDMALKYARSRKTTSDFDRGLRQQTILNAIKEKALSAGILTSPSKIKDLYDAISDNFVTNLSISEMAYLGEIADGFGEDSMLSQVLNDNPEQAGGFLYTPPREDYGGAFVLVPSSDDYSEIQLFANLFFYNTQIYQENIPLQIVNSSKYEGLATDTLIYLTRYGLNVVRYGNAPRIGEAETTIFDLGTTPNLESETVNAIKQLIPTAITQTVVPEDYSPINWESEAEILIELGSNFIPFYEENYEKRFYYWVQ
ncbi:MAG: LCP family protein [Candidatus Gracilibacteria bacterium]|jgi:LCP family protein required for cell wall assembly